MDKSLSAELIRSRFEGAAGESRSQTALYLLIRRLILDGELPPGCPLPPTRVLKSDLGLSRSTVVRAYEKLQVEGYLQSRGGSGTQVSETLSLAARQTLVATWCRDRAARQQQSDPERRIRSRRPRR